MSNNISSEKYIANRNLEELISEFCKNILIIDDELDFDTINKYISTLNKEEINILINSNLESDCLFIRNKLMSYIQSYQKSINSRKISSPFDFDSGNNLLIYRNKFEVEFKTITKMKIPKILSHAFDTIQEMSEHYRVFEQFYIIRSNETTDSILSKATQKAEEQARAQAEIGIKLGIKDAVIQATTEATTRATELATLKAENSANIAANKAKEAADKAKDASDKANKAAEVAANEAVAKAIEKKMNSVTAKMSETSVTILGIFSGIVLAVITGLFYSTSVIDNINSANFFKLLSVAALVGLICINLIALMFGFVEHIRNKSNINNFYIKLIKPLNVVLVVLTLFFALTQLFYAKYVQTDDEMQSDVNINITTPITTPLTTPLITTEVADEDNSIISTSIPLSPAPQNEIEQ